MLKETRVYGQPFTLRSDDDKAWFSRPEDLLSYRRRQLDEAQEFGALREWKKQMDTKNCDCFSNESLKSDHTGLLDRLTVLAGNPPLGVQLAKRSQRPVQPYRLRVVIRRARVFFVRQRLGVRQVAFFVQ